MILCLGTTPALQRVMVFERVNVGAVNRAVQVIEAPAGKSINVARVLRKLGRVPMATGFLGGDRGQLIRRLLDEDLVPHDFVEVKPVTRMCVTVIDRGVPSHTELVEESAPVAPADYAALIARMFKLLVKSRILVLSGTLAPGDQPGFYADCIKIATKLKIPTILDATGEPLRLALSQHPKVVKPNRAELEATLGEKFNDQPAVLRGMHRLIELGAENAVVTLGPDGALATDGRRNWRIHIPPVVPVNSIGSGDAFAAGLASALYGSGQLPDIARLGAVCGAANALTLMAGQIEYKDLGDFQLKVRVDAL